MVVFPTPNCLSVGFSGTPNSGTPYLYYSHTTPMFESLKIWELYGSRLPRGGPMSLGVPGITLDFVGIFKPPNPVAFRKPLQLPG